ncbi:hypothetical protein HZS_4411 [Henneguya salminicola]|nr:hypothetical protein HZS_4411 [Henneguya salminicola]
MMHMCFNDPYGVEFFKKTKNFFRNYVENVHSELSKFDEVDFGEKYMKEWNKYNLAISYVNDLYRSFNRNVVKYRHASFSTNFTINYDENFMEIDKLMYNVWYEDNNFNSWSK